ARALGCEVVATGHTADDQLEGALLGLVGVTGDGVPRAMQVQRELEGGVQLVRPLLGVGRAQVEAVAVELDLGWADDPSNADPDAYARNAVRHRVVPPLLEVHPGAGLAIARAAARAADERGVTDALADALLDTRHEAVPADAAVLDRRRIDALPTPARRAVLARWLVRQGLGRALDGRLVRGVDDLRAGRIDLPGGACVRCDGYHLTIHPAPLAAGAPQP
ncbi:MAG: tRNA(Ile)-lysidine synthetase, partial [Thermoleophilia bacterium]|nr:tRNA(Ile)-lysidine synthetase [Thermoleophilia bacterium]